MSDNIEIEVDQDPFTPVPNHIIHNEVMSLETKMTWIYLFSRRNMKNWKIRPFNVQQTLGFSDKVWRRVSKQLTQFGFLTAYKTKHGTTLKFTWSWDQISLPLPEVKNPAPKLTIVDNSVDNL